MNFVSKKMSWQGRPIPFVAERWSRWAHSISGQHRQVISKHRFVVMTLLRRVLPFYLSSQRWELKAWSLFPRINLAIEVRPQTFALKNSPLSRAAKARRGQQTDHHGLEMMPLVKRLEKDRSSSDGRNDEVTAAAKMDRATEMVTPAILNLTDAAGRRALDRVFRRLHVDENESWMRTVLRKERLNIVHRITQEHRRSEERTYTPIVLRQRQTTSPSQEKTDDLVRKSTNQQPTLDRFGSNMKNTDAMPAPFVTPNFNLEQLTDHVIRQIDDRIIAHKERMGKLF